MADVGIWAGVALRHVLEKGVVGEYHISRSLHFLIERVMYTCTFGYFTFFEEKFYSSPFFFWVFFSQSKRQTDGRSIIDRFTLVRVFSKRGRKGKFVHG